MTNWQVQPPPDNDGHARRYNPDTGRTDPFLLALGLVVLAVVGWCLFAGLRVIFKSKFWGIYLVVMSVAVAITHFLFDVPHIGKWYLIIAGGAVCLIGFVKTLIDIWIHYTTEEERS